VGFRLRWRMILHRVHSSAAAAARGRTLFVGSSPLSQLPWMQQLLLQLLPLTPPRYDVVVADVADVAGGDVVVVV